jgi:hypothetical protein
MAFVSFTIALIHFLALEPTTQILFGGGFSLRTSRDGFETNRRCKTFHGMTGSIRNSLNMPSSPSITVNMAIQIQIQKTGTEQYGKRRSKPSRPGH